MSERVVVADTNVFVSALLLPRSVSSKALNLALEHMVVVCSEESLMELGGVLARPKFERYLSAAERQEYFELMAGVVRLVNVPHPVVACRDPKDDKFLSLALSAKADYLLTGDHDLLVLHPFHNIQILSPTVFLSEVGSADDPLVP